MLFTKQLLLLASCLGLSAVVTAQDPELCSHGPHIITAPGRLDRTGATGLGLLNTLFNNLTAHYPLYSTWTVSYNYSTILFQTAPPQIIQHIQDYVQMCPKTPIVMIGYSIGGISHLNALCGLSSPPLNFTQPMDASYAKNIAAVIAYGEETRAANQTWNRGGCTNPAPTYARTNPEGCAPFSLAIHDYCNANDLYCCAGGITGTHYVYGPQYDMEALAFIKKRVYQFKKGRMPT